MTAGAACVPQIQAADLRGEWLILPSYADDTRTPLDRALRPDATIVLQFPIRHAR